MHSNNKGYNGHDHLYYHSLPTLDKKDHTLMKNAYAFDPEWFVAEKQCSKQCQDGRDFIPVKRTNNQLLLKKIPLGK